MTTNFLIFLSIMVCFVLILASLLLSHLKSGNESHKISTMLVSVVVLLSILCYFISKKENIMSNGIFIKAEPSNKDSLAIVSPNFCNVDVVLINKKNFDNITLTRAKNNKSTTIVIRQYTSTIFLNGETVNVSKNDSRNFHTVTTDQFLEYFK